MAQWLKKTVTHFLLKFFAKTSITHSITIKKFLNGDLKGWFTKKSHIMISIHRCLQTPTNLKSFLGMFRHLKKANPKIKRKSFIGQIPVDLIILIQGKTLIRDEAVSKAMLTRIKGILTVGRVVTKKASKTKEEIQPAVPFKPIGLNRVAKQINLNKIKVRHLELIARQTAIKKEDKNKEAPTRRSEEP